MKWLLLGLLVLTGCVSLPAPTFTVTTLAGDTYTLPADAVIAFWAPSCLPCREEMPALQAAYAAGTPVVGIGLQSFGDSAADMRAFAVEAGITFPLAVDGGVARRYRVTALPTTVVVKAGKVVSRKVGT